MKAKWAHLEPATWWVWWTIITMSFFILNRFFPSRVTGRLPAWKRQVHPWMGPQVIAGPNVRYLAQGYLSIATKVLRHSPSTTRTPAMFLSTPGPEPRTLHFLAQSPNKETYYRHLAHALKVQHCKKCVDTENVTWWRSAGRDREGANMF